MTTADNQVDGPSNALRELRELSVRLGRNAALIQGAGGNTSVKDGNILWVKASGRWLSAADDDNIFVGLRLDGVRRRVIAGDTEPVLPEVIDDPSTVGLRPSIEATLHALMTHKFVLHVHSVNAIAWAVRADAESRLEKLLDGLRWRWLPYARPGIPLTRAVQKAIERRPADVLVIGNHGLVVGGSTAREAEDLLSEVERRLKRPVRAAPPPRLVELARLEQNSPYRLPADTGCHVLATHPENLRLATAGSLYPDHVVFLGVGATRLRREQDIEALVDFRIAAGDALPAMLLIEDAGVLVRDNLSAGAEEMVRCLAMVVGRIPDDVVVNYLSDEQNAELLQWEAERYRQ